MSGNTLRAAYVKTLSEPIAAKLLGFDLSAVGCVGPMPSCIGDFRDCQSVMLGWNSLYGPIPYGMLSCSLSVESFYLVY